VRLTDLVLLSSHRDYATEKDWEYLRNDSAYADALQFEKVSGGVGEDKFEMVVTDRWRSKVSQPPSTECYADDQTKTNREDGSYATGDLYQPHPTKQNVWRYAGRGDDVIVMVSFNNPCLLMPG
jgi:hypothetical protein